MLMEQFFLNNICWKLFVSLSVSFRQCIAHVYLILMSIVPTTKWEADLHGANFWIHGCGGHSKVLQNTGLRIWMLELLYDIPRVTLFYDGIW